VPLDPYSRRKAHNLSIALTFLKLKIPASWICAEGYYDVIFVLDKALPHYKAKLWQFIEDSRFPKSFQDECEAEFAQRQNGKLYES
jgi:hypothetical protein